MLQGTLDLAHIKLIELDCVVRRLGEVGARPGHGRIEGYRESSRNPGTIVEGSREHGGGFDGGMRADDGPISATSHCAPTNVSIGEHSLKLGGRGGAA